jgi:two-component sensor histidine kinase
MRQLPLLFTLALLYGLPDRGRLGAQASGTDTATDLLERYDRLSYQSLNGILPLLQEAEGLARSEHDPYVLSRAYTHKANYYRDRGRKDSVDHYELAAYRALKASHHPAAPTALRKAEINLALTDGRDAEALVMSQQLIEACRESGDTDGLVDAYWLARQAFYYQGRYEQSAAYGQRSLDLLEETGDTLRLINILYRHANALRLSYRDSAAIQTYARVDELLEGRDLPYLESGVRLNEGALWMELDSFRRSERLLNRALPLARRSGSLTTEALILGNLGQLEVFRKNYAAAIPYLRQELALAADFGDAYYTFNFQDLLSEAHAALGRYDSAYHYANQAYLSYQDHVEDDYAEQLASLQVRYETSEKEGQIARQDELLQQQRALNYTIGAALIAALLAGLVLFLLSQRLSTRNRENQRLLDEKQTLIGEVHHRVKNNLQVISSLLQLQSSNLAAENSGARGALRESQSRVQAMGLIHQRLYHGTHRTTVDMPEYLAELSDVLLETYRLDDRIEVYCDVDALSLDVDTAVPLGLIVNELITNSLKYAFPGFRFGMITITLRRLESGLIKLVVSDDGVGQTPAEEHPEATSFGSKLIGILAKKLQATLHTSVDGGRTVRLEFTPP